MTFFDVHTHNVSAAADVVEIVNQYPASSTANISLYSVGVHPWYASEKSLEKELSIIEEHLRSDSCVAIGECGLDKKCAVPITTQIPAFEAQLRLAMQYNKPVIIHCVSAFAELIEIKNRLQIAVPMIIHGFVKKHDLAMQLIRQGFYLSFGKHLLKANGYAEILKNLPDDRIFLETDGDEAGIRAVYQTASAGLSLSVEELGERITRNAKNVFKLSID